MSEARRLPAYDEVSAARAALALSHRAHHAVHKLNELVAAHEAGRLPRDAAAVVAEVAADWAAYDQPDLALADRALAMRDGMASLARVEKEREDALEKLLYAQYHLLQDDADLADVRAILDPLYAERAALYETLVPMWYEVQVRRAGIAQVASMRALFPHAAPDAAPAQIVASAPTRRAFVESIAQMLPAMKIDGKPPDPPADDAVAAVHLAYVAAFDAWFVAESAAVEVFGAAASRDYDRWNEINRAIEAHTG